MKKLSILLGVIALALTVNAQSIMLQNSNKGISMSKDNFSGFETTFSFNEIESTTIANTERGTFSALTIAGTMPAGEVGTPQLPVFKKFIAVPVDATPTVVVKNYTVTEYSLGDYDLHTIYPVQPDVPKNQKLEDAPFVYNAQAYSVAKYNSAPIASVEVLGTMRGVRLGMLFVNPVHYNPVNQTIMVYNDIEVEVIFENGNYQKTEDLYVKTFSPYFEKNYDVVFNRGAAKDIFGDHPDLYNTPVHMLVLAHSMFQTEPMFQAWLEWKTQKGFYVDIEYVDGMAYTAIKTLCQTKYNQGVQNGTAPTFVVIVGDVEQVPASKPGTSSQTNRSSDLYYGSVDGDYFPEMYYSRLSAQNTQQLANQIEKILYYEKYQFADPTYLDNVLLIAGADPSWNSKAGQPAINYATTHYYNTAHGYANGGVHTYLTSPYTGCYNHLNNVGFANYTAHGAETGWSDPSCTASTVNGLTNTGKYFIAMGNCCLAADFGYGECFGETMMRAQQKGAVGYIGSCPLTYWHDDFHFAVGAYPGQFGPPGYGDVPAYPTLENTKEGVYDVAFHDEDFNCLSSWVMTGNLNVTYAIQTSGYVGDTQPIYYWEAYNVLGDGSLMPFNTQGNPDNVNNISPLPLYIGLPTYEVSNLAPGSYVAISKDGELRGTAVADENGVATVTLDPPIDSGGDVMIVVTRNQYIPYINTEVQAIAQSGSYVTATMELSTGNEPYSGATVFFDVNLKNVGIETATGIEITLTTESEDVILINHTASLASLDAGEEELLSEIFNVEIKNYLPDEMPITFTINIVSDNNEFQKNIKVIVLAPKLKLTDIAISRVTGTGAIAPGDEVNIDFEVANVGHADIADVFSTAFSFFSGFELFENEQAIEQINVGESQHVTFNGKVGDDLEDGVIIPVHFYAFKGTYTAEETSYIIIGTAMEDFETGNFLKFPWEQGTNPWEITSSNVYQGTYCARSKTNLGDDNISQLKMTTFAPNASTVSYARNVSSENNYDWFRFYVDGVQKEQVSGTSNSWTMKSFPVEAGVHTYLFEYSKDYSVSQGLDCAWIDNVTIPGMGVVVEEDLPQIKVIDHSIEGLIDGVMVGETTITFDLKNIGVVNADGILVELSCGDYPVDIAAENSGNNQELPFSMSVNEEKPVIFNLACQEIDRSDADYVEFVLKVELEETGIVAYYPVVIMCMCGMPDEPELCEPPANPEGKAELTTAVITWEEPEIDGILLGYNIYRDENFETPLNGEELLAELTYSDEGLENRKYIYHVGAVYEHCDEALTEGIEVEIDVLNINELANNVSIYPNPTSGTVTIVAANFARVEIYNTVGQLVETKTVKSFDVSTYHIGIYFFKIYDAHNNSVTKRVMITK